MSSEGRKRKKRKASKKMPFKQERKREKRKEREAEEEEKNLRRKLAIVQGVEKSKSSRAKVGSGSGSGRGRDQIWRVPWVLRLPLKLRFGDLRRNSRAWKPRGNRTRNRMKCSTYTKSRSGSCVWRTSVTH